MEVMGEMGNARGTLRDRLRGALSGLTFVGALMLAVIALNVLKSMVNALPEMQFLRWCGDCIYLYSIQCLLLLPILPLWVMALNSAPRAGVGRIAWLAVATAAYAWTSSHVPTRWLFPKFDTSDVFDASLVTSIFMVCGAFEFRRRASATASALLRARIDAVAQDAQLDRARLTLLRAQIEPHFLFNTLATVKRLYETAPARGREMLSSLIGYLRAALPTMRQQGSTLRREIELARAYLTILQMRMGERLVFWIEVPDDLLDAEVPPLVLGTLLENALKHGLAPLPEGGTILIRAARDAEQLRVEVVDSGRGFLGQGGSGVGLANTRSRLAALYGASAALQLAANHPSGVVATVVLPLVFAASAMPDNRTPAEEAAA